MKLYHYSSAAYTKLLTRRKQGVSLEVVERATKHANILGDPGPYIDHISLFIEPPPLNSIGNIFKNQHEFWRNGNKIYEHVIDSDSLEANLLYQLVETPEMDKYADQFDWTIEDKRVRTTYIIKLNQEMKDKKYTGFGTDIMIRKLNPYLGRTEEFYRAARKKWDAEETAKQYAAYVPHLMVYPRSGEIKIESVRSVIIGTDYNSLANQRKSTKW